MKNLPKLPFALVALLWGALPSASFAQQSQFNTKFAATSEICTEENAGQGNRTACFQNLLPLLSEVRQASSGPQYDTEIGAIALAIVNAYTNVNAPAVPVCGVIADALDQVAQSAADTGQAGQISAIATRVRACSGLDSGIERLLASPN
ncbi:MAG: hypothetical protein COB08_010835 [Rhodobacteraceae bacterium]|nr:hypothetical protein [Paracoccaceae bacterium]